MLVTRVLLAWLLLLVAVAAAPAQAAPVPTVTSSVPIDPTNGHNAYGACPTTVSLDTFTIDVSPGQLLRGFIAVERPESDFHSAGRAAMRRVQNVGAKFGRHNQP